MLQSSFPNGHDASDVRDVTSVDTGTRHCARYWNWKPPRWSLASADTGTRLHFYSFIIKHQTIKEIPILHPSN
jgi:hypothetical protein